MPELLLELGCEELPASFVRKAYTDLHEAVCSRLRDRGIAFEPGEGPMGTPRRLILHLLEVAAEQPGTTEEKRGPSEQAAFDASGNPSPALIGFCRGLGADPAHVKREGGYVWASKETPGRQTLEVLSEILPEAIRSLSFEKAMRWGSSRMRFARPMRWILASFGGVAVPFEIEGVASGLESRGHRFFFPEPFEVREFRTLADGLRRRMVEPDAKIREERIRSGAKGAASGDPDLDEALVEENVFLSEWPEALEGTFKPEFLELPEPVLVTAMAKHERFFPVRSSDGKLLNRFISIRGGGEEETVRGGNEWVLNARFNDARFFYEEDKRLNLEAFLEKTKGIVFQETLGTIRQRADRLALLTEAVARATSTPEDDPNEPEWARQAGLYAKADLSSGLVSDLASLQGVVGGEYARREGFPDAVCCGISRHYDPSKIPAIRCKGARTALRLHLADQLDKLAGYLGLGLAPSGSSDPFGLRRAATALIEVAMRWPGRFPNLSPLVSIAHKGYLNQGVPLKEDPTAVVRALVAARYENAMPEFRHDILDAATMQETSYQLDSVADAPLDPQSVAFRCRCLTALASDTAFVRTATRPINIVADAARKGRSPDRQDPLAAVSVKDLDSETGEALLESIRSLKPTLESAASNLDATRAEAEIRKLAAPINAFFDATMVNAEDEKARTARLNLVNAVCGLLALVGDFSKLVIEG